MMYVIGPKTWVASQSMLMMPSDTRPAQMIKDSYVGEVWRVLRALAQHFFKVLEDYYFAAPVSLHPPCRRLPFFELRTVLLLMFSELILRAVCWCNPPPFFRGSRRWLWDAATVAIDATAAVDVAASAASTEVAGLAAGVTLAVSETADVVTTAVAVVNLTFDVVAGLVVFYGRSTFVGYSMPNTFLLK